MHGIYSVNPSFWVGFYFFLSMTGENMTVDVHSVRTLADFEALASLANRLAAYHGELLSPDFSTLYADRTWFSAVLVSRKGRDIGYASWHKTYVCQSATRGVELQNLYVEPDYRGQRIGLRLVLEVAVRAIRHKAELSLGVRKTNLSACAFYQKLGFTLIDRGDDLWRAHWDLTQIRAFVAKVQPADRPFLARNFRMKK